MARRRKQKKQVREALDLRTFESTPATEALLVDERAAGLPRFFIESIVGAYGETEAERILDGIAAAQKRPVTLRANTLKASADEVASVLNAAQIPWQPVSWFADAFEIEPEHERAVWDLELIRQGSIYLQSLSSMLPPLVLVPKAGQDVLDMCAAPGGKTTQLAAMCPAAHITACEMHIPRAEKLEHNLEKQGAKNVQVMRCDARQLDEFFSFDKILLDAPCTGSGTLISGNERTLRGFTPELLEKCARSQRALLDRGLTVLKRGGTLLYSTCSVLPQENEDAVRAVLAKHRDCEIVPLLKNADETEGVENAPAPAVLADALTHAFEAGEIPVLQNELAGTLTVRPTREYEGFYLALIKKN